MKSTPRMLPTIQSAVDFQYASRQPNEGHAPEITKAGIVKMAPAAKPSPMDPAVRAIFSSSSEPFHTRSTAMAITAAGYVAAIVIPARNPKYALAAPRTTVSASTNKTARQVNSFIAIVSGTNGRRLVELPVFTAGG